MLRSGPGHSTGLPPTSTVPSVAGNCGRSPAISRRTVDLPQPDGPRIAMNSPLSGRSGTEKVTSRITVTSPNRFVTFRKSTTDGTALVGDSVIGFDTRTALLLDRPERKEASLEPEQQTIDAVRQ